jgi:hypothetical protein
MPEPESTGIDLETLPGASEHPDTIHWRERDEAGWQACRRNCQAPEVVMPRYADWLKSLPAKPVFVGSPVAGDFMFVYWYLIRFAGESPFSRAGIDIKTLAMALLKTDYCDASTRLMPNDSLPNLRRPVGRRDRARFLVR